MSEGILNIIKDNSKAISILILLFAIILGILIVILRYRSKKWALKMAEIGIESKKIDVMADKMRMEHLKEAALVLTDDEKKKLDSIRGDRAILSRKKIAKMSEVEERIQRLELGTDVANLSNKLRDVKTYEDQLFRKNDNRDR